MKHLLAILVVLIGMTTLAAAQPYPPPPGLHAERVPPRPGSRYIWQPGHWVWNGYSYAWVRGHYVVRAPYYHHWMHGHWANGPGGWVWVAPHWE
jgi:WXXGXW repeat (2 copies)